MRQSKKVKDAENHLKITKCIGCHNVPRISTREMKQISNHQAMNRSNGISKILRRKRMQMAKNGHTSKRQQAVEEVN